MKNKFLPLIIICILSVLCLCGCNPIGTKTTSMSIIYLVTTILSMVTLIGYLTSIKKKDIWFVVLFISVFIVNMGYLALSLSNSLNEALWANRLSYLGSVFLPLSMLMSIIKISKLNYKKWVMGILLGISTAVFLIAASPGYLDIYYKSVSLETINGISILVKDYGSWHCIYLFYLLGFFGAMVGTTIHAAVKKKIESTAHATIILVSVFVNICVWLLEQLVKIDFEFLSVSYIITELFLISVYIMIQYQDNLITSLQEKLSSSTEQVTKPTIKNSPEFVENLNFFSKQLSTLTSTEKAIYDCYVAGMSTKEVLAQRSIAESTLKYHNSNLYSKLGVSSRKQLLEYARAINTPDNEESVTKCTDPLKVL